MADFTTPSFLTNHGTDDIHRKMLSLLPADLDISEGGHTWNLTRSPALGMAEICEYVLPEVIKLIFPEFSYGTFLDYHAKRDAMKRRAATYASGSVTVSGAAGSLIPAGSTFATMSINDEPSVSYETLEAAIIPDDGAVEIAIQCTQPGIVGNTAKNTIVQVGSRLTGITGVINQEAVSGGTEEETDESLSERIVEYELTQGESFVGCVADYKRWALSVDGVGEVTVIPAQDTTGLVTIVVTDGNGDPATDQLCTDVYDYIMVPENPDNRRAPVNALLSVIPPDTIAVSIRATIELKEDATIEAVQETFLAKVASYLPKAMDEGEIKYTQIAKVLATVDGVNDFIDLEIGIADGEYGTANIPISNRQLPRIANENLVFTAGTV